MRKILACAAAISATAVLCSASAQAEIRIGATLAITGPASFLGDPEKKTLEIYAEEINKSGGLLGEQIELFIYDDGADASKARTFATRLIEEDEVDVVLGGSSSGTSLAIAPIFEDAGIPFISLAGAAAIVEPVRRWVFKTPQTEPMSCGKIFEDLKARGLTKIGMISGTDGWGKAMREECLKMAPDVDMTVVADELYGASDSDMTPQLTNIKNTDGVQAVINCGFGQGPAIVTRNFRQLGFDIPLYQSHGVSSKSYIELSAGAAEGVRLPAGAVIVADKLAADDPLKQVVTDYKATYEARTGQPVSTFGGHMYDALNLYVEAVKRAGSTDKEKVRDEIEKTTGFVGTGGIVNMAPDDHLGLALDAFRMVEIRNNDWELVE
jgi:branched-chain amino acid transport system substrate-binding protein